MESWLMEGAEVMLRGMSYVTVSMAVIGACLGSIVFPMWLFYNGRPWWGFLVIYLELCLYAGILGR